MNISVKAVLLDMRRIQLSVTCVLAQTNVLRTTKRDIMAIQGLSGEFSNPNMYGDVLVLTGLLGAVHIRMRDFSHQM